MMLCSRSRTRTRTHTRTLLLLVLVVTVAHRLQSSTVLGMTIPFSNGNGFSSSGSGSGHHEWHETASGIPTTGADWITLPNGQEFQPATFGGDGADGDAGSADHSHSDHSNHSDSEQERAKLVRAQRRFLGYRDNFVDGTETFYSERSQAWRLLGVYIDCDAQDNGDDHKDRRDRDRQLKQQPPQQQQPQSGAGAGLKQQVPKEEDDQDNRKLEDDVQQCQRYMLWAGYVDLDYQGGGVAEYQYFDTYTQEWDETACELRGNGRCSKMDCHLKETHFTLLGFFKNADYDDFFEQLFKHEGVCLWQNDEYDFMDAYRTVWPQYCTASTISYRGNYLYYDIKPTSNGEMGIGLYTDAACSVEYRGGKSMDSVLSQKDCSYDDDCVNLDISLDTFLQEWNAALDRFRVCIPCASFDINDDDRRRSRGRNRQLGEGGDEEGTNYNYDDAGHFQCDDEAGYTNVNQCMKFGTHTDLERASFEDVALATQQNTVLNPHLEGIQTKGFSKVKKEFSFLTISVLFSVSGTVFFAWATRRRRHRRSSRQAEAPLV